MVPEALPTHWFIIFKYYKMGYASAIAVILFVMLLIVTIIQWVHNNKEEKG